MAVTIGEYCDIIDNEFFCKMLAKSDIRYHKCDFNQKHKITFLCLGYAPDEALLSHYINITLSTAINLCARFDQNQFVKHVIST